MTELKTDAEILLIVEKEYDEIKEKAFWKKYMVEIEKEKKRVAERCITSREHNDVRFYQGGFQSIKDILDIPGNIIKELRKGRVAQKS